MGAIGGCVVGHHMANEKAKEKAPPAPGAEQPPLLRRSPELSEARASGLVVERCARISDRAASAADPERRARRSFRAAAARRPPRRSSRRCRCTASAAARRAASRPRRTIGSAPRAAPHWTRRRLRPPPRAERRQFVGGTASIPCECDPRPHRPPPPETRRRDRRRRAGASGATDSAAWRTAVLSPDSEKSASGRPSNGRGSANRVGSPPFAAASTAGPPGNGSPSNLAVLSNASPMASSMVAPSRS